MMKVENDNQSFGAVVASLTGMRCFFIITPKGTLFLLEPNGQFIDTKEIYVLLESSSLGIYNAPILQMLQAYPMSKASHRAEWVESTLNQDQRIWSHILTKYNLAIKLANEIAQKYNVNVAILETNSEYDSEESLLKTITNQIYFISQEDPVGTKNKTEFLLKYINLNEKIISKVNNVELLKTANAKRFEKADQTALQINEKINEIKKTYGEANHGKEPSLSKIAEILTEEQVESPNGSTKWFAQTVKRILERSEIKR